MAAFSTLRGQVAAYMHDTSTATDTLIKAWINEAYQEILGFADYTFLMKKATITTAVGTSEYNLATDVDHIIEMAQTNTPIKLEQISLRDYLELIPNTSESGYPLYYMAIENNSQTTKKIKFHPIPSAIGTVTYRYYQQATDLSADADIPLLPTDWHWLIMKGGLVRGLQYLNDFQTAYLVYQSEYLPGVARLIREDRRRPDYRTQMKEQGVGQRRFLKFPAGYPFVG